MTVQDYERQGGFREELAVLREIGMRMVTLTEAIPARPHRPEEMQALNTMQDSLRTLMEEINITRAEGKKEVPL